ncbi:hypothetical protein Acr_00g0071350 [Actinidia rufa]|uniref:Bulb-type lectin domain-containing protein n=1 Tax=Actinidia rufa TaxID=165716 RepID=A0A7J0DTA0_9ERIC|nr:hypothetical protein Acr_00g0071350 [Actinidia rufa]
MARMRRKEYFKVILSCLVVFWFICIQGLHAVDTLTVGQTMRDWEFLESPNKLFRLLFSSPYVANVRYLGIQYMNDRLAGIKFVWVANIRIPLTGTSGILNITVDGNLVLTDSNGIFVTISAGQPAISNNTSATLHDSGNLVLRSGERQPQHRLLTSFVSQQVPTPGTFTFGVDPNNTKQLVIWQRGILYWWSGIWNGSAAGCAVIETSNCKSGDVFNQTPGQMNSWNFLYNFSLGIADCKEICSRNCSCNAYGSASSNGSGCKFSDVQRLNFSEEEVFYIRNGRVEATGKPY